MDKPGISNEQIGNLARWLKVICEPNRLDRGRPMQL